MVRAGWLVHAGFLALAAAQAPTTTPVPPRACQLQVAAANSCLVCAGSPKLCTTARTDSVLINLVNDAEPKACADAKACTFELYRDWIKQLTFTDPDKVVTSLSVKRFFADGATLWRPNNVTFSNLTALTKLEFIGNRPYIYEGKDRDTDYFEVSPVNSSIPFAASLKELVLKEAYTSHLSFLANSQLMTLDVQGSELDAIPTIGTSNVEILTFNSHRDWDFPYQVLESTKLILINLPNNRFNNLTFTSDKQFEKFKEMVSTTKLTLQDSRFANCPKQYVVQGCPQYRASPIVAADKSTGPSSGAVTTLVVVCCIASVLVLVALVVHRRNRHHSEMSPGILNSNSPDEDFYDLPEAEITNHTLTKFNTTAGLNDTALTRIPQEQIALARCIGGDIWSGEMGNNRIVLRRAPRFAGNNITTRFLQGVKEMARLSHPNLVTYLGVTCISNTDIYAVAEFMDKGSLISVYQTMPLTWEVQLGMATDVAEALHYLHTFMPSPVPVEHLRSSNVLVSNTFSCKLNIFNFMASYKSHTMCKEMYGHNQLAWRAPEVLLNEMKNFLMADIYSMGVILAEIGTCTRPFDREIGEVGTVHTDVWIVDSVMAGKGVPLPYDPKSPKWTNLPEDYQKLVKACLSASPSQRPNSGIILQRLKALKKEGIEL